MTEKEREEAENAFIADARRQMLIKQKLPLVRAEKEKRFSEADLERGAMRKRQSDMSYRDLTRDVARSATAGISEGVVSAPGAPIDIYRLGQLAKAYTSSRKWNPFADEQYKGRPYADVLSQQDLERETGARKPFLGLGFEPQTVKKYGGEAYIQAAKPYFEDLQYKTQTPLGETARTVGNVAAGGMTGDLPLAIEAGLARGGRVAAKELSRSARTSTATGAAVGGTEYATEGDPGWQLAAGLVAGPLARQYGTKGADVALRDAVTPGTRFLPGQVDRANALVDRAREHGLALTRANALDFVTGGGAQGLSELQRVIESASPDMLRFFAENAPPGPSRVRAAVERQLNTIAPASQQPGTIGPRVAEQANRAIAGERADVNASVRNAPEGYASFERAQVDPGVMQAMMNDPHWAATANRVINDTQYASFLQNTPPGSVGFMQLVNQQIANERRELTRGTGRLDPQAAEGIRGSQESGEAAASLASRQLPPGQPVPPTQSPLDAADQQRAVLQERVLDPLEQGSLGEMARSTTTEGVHGALKPALEGSGQEIGTAVRTLAQQDPNIANELVRSYLGTAFEQQSRPNVAGEPYSAGTKFWKTIAGGQGSEDREALQQMMTALPNGDALWQGFNGLGTIFEAQGKRQAPGSRRPSTSRRSRSSRAARHPMPRCASRAPISRRWGSGPRTSSSASAWATTWRRSAASSPIVTPGRNLRASWPRPRPTRPSASPA